MAARSELRAKSRRHSITMPAFLIDATTSPRPCSISDISETGARIMLESECELPERFILLLTPAAKRGAIAGWFGATD